MLRPIVKLARQHFLNGARRSQPGRQQKRVAAKICIAIVGTLGQPAGMSHDPISIAVRPAYRHHRITMVGHAGTRIAIDFDMVSVADAKEPS